MAQQQAERQENAPQTLRRNALNDGIGYRRISRPANDEITPGSPWALAPWPTLEIAKWMADRLDRYLPWRGNRAVLSAAGTDAQAQLQAVMHEDVIPALRGVRDQLAAEGYDVSLDYEAMGVTLRTRGFNGRVIAYTVTGGVYQEPMFALVDVETTGSARRHARIHIGSRGRTREVGLRQCSTAAIRRDALHELRNQILY